MKKIISAVLAGCLVFSASAATQMNVESYSYETPVSLAKTNEATPEAMEQMIKKVRPLIDVPEDYTVFEWNFNAASVYSEASWNFSWANYEKGEIYVTSDNQGRITGYRIYNYNSSRTPVLPEASPEDYKETVTAFVAKIAPYTEGLDLRLSEVGSGSIYSPCYTYYFTRYENDIIVPDEYITVTFDYSLCEVTRFSSYLSDSVEFKQYENIITEDEAKEILSENQKMTLSYRLKTEYDDEGNLISRKAYLVYTPDIGYISVDAESGEVYTERNTWETVKRAPTLNGALMDSDSVSKEESAESEAGGGYQLSEEELAQLAVLESLIKKDEAIKIVTSNEKLYIDPVANVVTAHLAKNRYGVRPLNGEDASESYVWNIYFSAPETLGRDYPYYYHSMNAVVDASTGEIISFHAEIPDYYYYVETEKEVPSLKYTDTDAQDIASEFIKEMLPDKYENVRYSTNYHNTPILYTEDAEGKRIPTYGVSRMTFVRQNEGVDFTYNNVQVGVELITGKVTNYNYSWYDDVVFESPKDAIGEKQALMSLYSYDGFGINYEVNAHYTYNEYLTKEFDGEYIDYDKLFDTAFYSRAVYSAYGLGTTTIRALDGKMIDYSGEEYVENGDFYSYDDISSHWAQETIMRFSWIGMGFDGGKFEPSKDISFDDFVNLCSSVGLYSYEFEPETTESITRMDAVKYIIDCLGYSKIAGLENVFITDFVDNSDFLAGDVGYAAIARGFGLIQGDGENFRPYDILTRAEAYTIAANVVDLGMTA